MSALQRSTNELLLTSPGLAPDQSSWFAIQTRPRYEKKVTAELQEKGIKTFLPLYSALHQWSDRRRLVHSPIFPGYVFVRIAPVLNARIAVLRTNGVSNFVGVRNIGVADPRLRDRCGTGGHRRRQHLRAPPVSESRTTRVHSRRLPRRCERRADGGQRGSKLDYLRKPDSEIHRDANRRVQSRGGLSAVTAHRQRRGASEQGWTLGIHLGQRRA